MSNLIKRTISGIVFVAILLGSLCNELSFVILFTLISALATWEFCTLLNRNEHVQINRLVTTVAGTYLSLSIALFYMQAAPFTIFVPYLLMLIYLLTAELYLKQPNPINNWAFSFAAQLYIALPLALIQVLAFKCESDFISTHITFRPEYPLALLVFLWINDTGAYLCGSTLQKYCPYKLFPRISPNKSWIGSIGGAILVSLSSCIFSHYYPLLSPLQWIGFGLVVVVFGTWGDLVESLLKRQLGVKDSGNFLPGHGGVLDRFDSLILATPAVVIYLSLLHQL